MLNDDVEDEKYLPTRSNILRELYELKNVLKTTKYGYIIAAMVLT